MKFNYGGKNYNTSDRTVKGQSDREYWASITGQDKKNFPGSGGGGSSSSKSSGSSSNLDSVMDGYKAKKFNYNENSAITSPVNSAYDAAKKTYLDMLPALKPRYEELYAQLEAEKGLAAEKNAQLSGEELSANKKALAARGVEVTSANQGFTAEEGKLKSLQATRDQETNLGFSRERLNVAGAEAADTRDINSAVAGLELDRAKTINDIVTNDKNFQYGIFRDSVADDQWKRSMNYNVIKDKNAEQQWKMTFQATQDNAAADRSLEYYKLAKSTVDSKDTKYNDAMASIVSSAYSGTLGKQEGLRENLRDQLIAQFPGMETKINEDIYKKFFPAGFESRIPETKSSRSSEVQKVMDGLGVDEATATKLVQQKLGV
jgi:hypothetical protein